MVVGTTATIHLDTNYLIHLEVAASRQAKQLQAWIEEGHAIAVSSIAWSEYLCGPPRGDPDKEAIALTSQIVGVPVAFGGSEAELSAKLFNLGGRRPRSLADCQIAAVALRAGAQLATANAADFAAFAPAGLMLARS